MGRCVVALVVVMVAAAPAVADPAAEKLFRDGQAAMERKATAEACDLFARSQQLEPLAGTALYLATCLEQLGKPASAWEAYMTATALATAAKQKPRAAFCRRRANALLPGLAYLTIVVPLDLVTGFALTRNGAALERAVWNVAVPVDPGDHTVVATAPGYEDWSETRTIGGGQHATIMVADLTAIAAMTTTDATTTDATTTDATTTDTTTTDATTTDATTGAASGATDPAGVTTTAPPPRARKLWALGVTVGETTGPDPMFGIRVFRDVPVGKGAFRGMFTALYDNFNDDHSNGFMRSHQILFGGAAEYTWSSSKSLRFAVGVTTGLDLLFRNQDRPIHAAPWWGIRISPVIVRALDTVEIGLHLQGIQSTDRLAAFGLVAVDWYVR